MFPYWVLPCRSPLECEARASAKREYEEAHPLPESKPRRSPYKVKGGLMAGWVFHPIMGGHESKLVHMIATAGHEPIPRDLLKTEMIDGKLHYVGVSGKQYEVWEITPRTAVIALDHAVEMERIEERHKQCREFAADPAAENQTAENQTAEDHANE